MGRYNYVHYLDFYTKFDVCYMYNLCLVNRGSKDQDWVSLTTCWNLSREYQDIAYY